MGVLVVNRLRAGDVLEAVLWDSQHRRSSGICCRKAIRTTKPAVHRRFQAWECRDETLRRILTDVGVNDLRGPRRIGSKKNASLTRPAALWPKAAAVEIGLHEARKR